MTVYRRESDGLYIGVIDLGRDGTGKRRRKTVSSKTKKRTMQKLRELRATLEQGLVLGPTDRTTVESWVRYWLENIAATTLRPRTLVTYRAAVNQQIIPAIGQYRLVKLGTAEVREMNLRKIGRASCRERVL